MMISGLSSAFKYGFERNRLCPKAFDQSADRCGDSHEQRIGLTSRIVLRTKADPRGLIH